MAFDIAMGATWVTFLMSLFALIGVVKNFMSSGTKENTDAIAALREACESTSRRLLKVESDLEHLPTSNELNRLTKEMAEMKGELKAVNKSVETSERSIQRVEKFLLNNKGSA